MSNASGSKRRPTASASAKTNIQGSTGGTKRTKRSAKNPAARLPLSPLMANHRVDGATASYSYKFPRPPTIYEADRATFHRDFPFFGGSPSPFIRHILNEWSPKFVPSLLSAVNSP
jgi:hypothetical protein